MAFAPNSSVVIKPLLFGIVNRIDGSRGAESGTETAETRVFVFWTAISPRRDFRSQISFRISERGAGGLNSDSEVGGGISLLPFRFIFLY